MSDVLLTGGRVIDPSQDLDQVLDVYLRGGKVVEVAKGLSEKYASAHEVFDVKGKVVSPGLIDMHVHLREPGREDRETIHQASRAAAKGGITSVVAMPNTTPIADDQTVLEYVLSKAKKESLVNVYVSGTITKGEKGREIAEIWELKKTGAILVTDDGFDVGNVDVYRKALQYCKTHSMLVMSHTEDHELSHDGVMHEGVVSSRLGLKGIPACGEDIATARNLFLAEEVGTPIHFTHVSTLGAVDLIRQAKARGVKVTADATPHHFSLTDEAVEGFNTLARVNPPLRSQNHVDALLAGLKDGTIDAIATDHAPHCWFEKEREFQNAPNGIVGLETALSLMITKLVDSKTLSLSEALSKMTTVPAQILGLDSKGSLEKGQDADLFVFDPDQTWTVDRTKFESKGQNSPFHGMTLKGVVSHTIVGGIAVMKDGDLMVI